uniref:Uncharacterized protein n=1 Tax=Macaca fascicularis TaxID=9541 RepID=A0A7N9DCN0_MACFA
MFVISHGFYVAGIQERLTGGSFGLGSLVKLQARCQMKLQSSESLTVLESLLQLHGWKVGADYGKPQFHHKWTLPQDCLSILTTWQLMSPRAINLRQRNVELSKYFIIWLQKSYTIISTVFYW